MLEVKVRDEIRESHAEDYKKTEDSQPHEHEGALILPGRRRRDSEDEVQSRKNFARCLIIRPRAGLQKGSGPSHTHRPDAPA